MARKNSKKLMTSYENSVKKSNELSMSKLNQGLTLNQMQLLAFAIYSTQQNNGVTEFIKVEFEKKFNIEQYRTEDAKTDSYRLLDLKVSMEDLENDKFSFWNIFMGMEYEKGHFSFEWNPKMIPHILELQTNYVSTDLSITSKFKSSFSWTLYEYLKAHYGYFHKPLSKETLMKLFNVEDIKSYKNNTGIFKKRVLDVAIEEINIYTELNVWYKEEKKGRAITGFDLHWSTGENNTKATNKQINELRTILDIVFDDVFKYINLKDDENRQNAIELVRETEEIQFYLEEPICITYEKADSLIKKANWNLKELERLLELNNQEKAPIYNWLENK